MGLKIHIESKHLEDLFKFPCEDCGFIAQGPRFLKQHQDENHGPDKKGKIVKTENDTDHVKIEQNSKDMETDDGLSIGSVVKKEKIVKTVPKIKLTSDANGQQNIQTLEKSQLKREVQEIKKDTTEDESELDLAVNEESNIDKIINDGTPT